ncbi:unnamed protein product [Oncorhynchus mykiss]|uniref:Uncharacterized protein n=1 Tax=Oncorhynchus mykiss TaxID=8022 RepID=A0A061AD99_ONCMY|nr:unnamed protein product [Oncorhynchus mykiss]
MFECFVFSGPASLLQAQRLLLQDGTLAHFMVPCSTALPSISTGLPGHGDWETGSYQRVARVLPQVYLPMERHSAAHHHLQPMFILEPSGLLHTQLVTGETHTDIHTHTHTPTCSHPGALRTAACTANQTNTERHCPLLTI